MRTGLHLVAMLLLVLVLTVAITAVGVVFRDAFRGELRIPEKVNELAVKLVPPPETGVEAADKIVRIAWSALVLIPLAVIAGAALFTVFCAVAWRR